MVRLIHEKKYNVDTKEEPKGKHHLAVFFDLQVVFPFALFLRSFRDGHNPFFAPQPQKT